MFLQKKALYNLIQLNLVSISEQDVQLESWQKENYRNYSTSDLFFILKGVGLPISEETFEQYASSFETPEEFSESVSKGFLPLEQDRIYLLIFELWRRLFPERQSLTIFCDELDHQIVQYEHNDAVSTPQIQDTLIYLQDILNKNVDEGIPVLNAVSVLQGFMANNLESFIYNYISDRLDEDDYTYAKELLEGFQKFFKEHPYFLFLSCRIEIIEDPETGYEKLEKLIKRIEKKGNIELNLEILTYLALTGNHSLFTTLAIQTIPLIHSEDDFRDIILICIQHFAYLELDPLTHALEALSEKRVHNPRGSILSSDLDLQTFKSILQQKLHV